MANTQSAKKNIRKTLKQTLHNRSVKSTLRTLEKKVKQATEAMDKKNPSKDAEEAVSRYVSALDKAAKRHIIHPNKAKRRKSACARLLASQPS